MLMRNLILVEHLGHVVSDRIPVVAHRHEGDLFAGFRVLVAGLRFGSLGLLGGLRSAPSHQYTSITSRRGLFEGFERGPFRDLVPAGLPVHVIVRYPPRHPDSETQ